MKIRIKGNAIRYRLTKTEVETFSETGCFSEETIFNTTTFVYELKAKDTITNLEADFSENKISVFVPTTISKDWASTTKVGFKHTQRLRSGEDLSILIEKDFVCLDDRDEDESDNYPNPKMA